MILKDQTQHPTLDEAIATGKLDAWPGIARADCPTDISIMQSARLPIIRTEAANDYIVANSKAKV
jgi:hypothetical protein